MTISYTKRQRIAMAKRAEAIPVKGDEGEIIDGLCPVASREDLKVALTRYKSATNKSQLRPHIRRRAKELGAEDLLPASLAPKPARKRGRPVGAPALTPDVQDLILSLTRKGAFDHVAAGVAGVGESTLREWIARGEGRSVRPATPKLRAFAKVYRKAKAEARALAEMRAYDEHLLAWLKHAGRSKDGLEGWTDMPAGTEASEPVSEDELLDLLLGAFLDLLLTDAGIILPSCGNLRCRCVFHRIRSTEDLAKTREIARKLRRELS
jgi:hypothetical protein